MGVEHRTHAGRRRKGVRIWKHPLPGTLFSDAYNPFAMVNVPGDWSWLDTKRVDMGPYFRRRGLVFVDGKPLEPMEQYRELGNIPLPGTVPPDNQPPRRTGLPSRSRGGPIMQEIGGSSDGRFWVEHQGNVIHIRMPSGDPNTSRVEISVREQAFAPRAEGLGYIRIKGLTFQHAGNAFPPPQRGLVSTGGGHHWIIEGNTIEWASGVGLDIGSQHWTGARDPQAGDSHVVRGNTLRYIGVEGIGGMGTTNTLVEDNLIEWVGWQDAERAWEAAGAKFHRARNLLFRRNVVRHIRHANAVWLDVDNSNSRITANVFADVLTVSAAIHMEMNRRHQPDRQQHHLGCPQCRTGHARAARCRRFRHIPACLGETDRRAESHRALRQRRCVPGAAPRSARAAVTAANTGSTTTCSSDAGTAASSSWTRTTRPMATSMPPSPQNWADSLDGENVQWLDLPAWRAHGWDAHGRIVDLDASFDADRLELSLTGKSPLPALPGFHPRVKVIPATTR